MVNISEEARLAKNKQIKEAGKATRARRAKLDCRVYHLKLQPNKATQEKLRLVFLEAKWLRNSSLAAQNYSAIYLNLIGNKVPVKTPTGTEERELKILSSQMKQGVLTQIRSDLKALSAAKKKGRKVGSLKYSTEIKSINLQQYGSTYNLDFKKSKARLQSIGYSNIRGLGQLAGHKELANAKLLQKPDGYYLAVTCYFEKGSKNQDFTPKTQIGVDMGVKTHLTLSNGKKIDSTVQETDRLKRLQRKLSRQVKGSKNSRKTKSLIRREYQKMDCRKQDFANKTVHELLKYETVFFQDENLTGWKVRSGKKLQHSALGSIKAKLVASDRAIMLNRFVPTTQSCECGVNTKHDPSKRVFICSSCNYSEDRDIHAAKNMIRMSKFYTSGTEGSACGGSNKTYEGNPHEHNSMKQETPMTLVSV